MPPDLSRRAFAPAPATRAAAPPRGRLPTPPALPRRAFVPAAAPGAVALAAGRASGANDRVRMAVVGCGGMGSGPLGGLVKRAEADNVQVVAVCDVYNRRL